MTTSARTEPMAVAEQQPTPPSAAPGPGGVFEYAPAPEATDHVRIASRYALFMGGGSVRAHSRRRFPTVNPATEETLSEVAEADEADVDRAVTAAADAFRSWSALAPVRRARYVFRLSRIIQ